MTDYSFGDIVVVPFPFSDQMSAKRRPAVVVSSSDYNTYRPDLVIMAVTSRIREPAPYGDTVVLHWREAGLLKPSAVKPVFTTIEKGLVLRSLGQLQEKDEKALRETLQDIIG